MKQIRIFFLYMLAFILFFNTFTELSIDIVPFIGLILATFIPSIIYTLYKFMKRNKTLKASSKSGIKQIDKMDGHQFEYYLQALLKELGYVSSVTKKSQDFGADLVFKKDGHKIVIQAKRYGYKKKVSIDAVQQDYAAKPFYKANEAWIITNSTFTRSATELAKVCDEKLFDRYKLVELITKINPQITAAGVISKVEPGNRKCPGCGANLLQRKSNQGNYFMGCSNYPTCRHTESVAN